MPNGQRTDIGGEGGDNLSWGSGRFTKAAGREIRYVPVSPEEYRSALLAMGLPSDVASPLVELFTTVLDGRNSYVADGVQRALGRAPLDFADYARDAAKSGAWTARH